MQTLTESVIVHTFLFLVVDLTVDIFVCSYSWFILGEYLC